MPLKLHTDRLVKEELEYEIKIRGAVPSGTVSELRSTLRQLINLQEEGHSFKMSHDFDIKEEIEACKSKISEIKQCLKEEFTSNLIKKVESKLAHVLNRIENISPVEENDRAECSKLLSEALQCHSTFEKKQELFLDKNKQINPIDIKFHSNMMQNAGTSTPKRDQSNISTDQVTQHMANTSINNNHNINISKWGLKFSGESEPNSLGLNAFLERVSELSESRGVTSQQLFKSAVELFEGKALIYYRSLRDQITDWETLCTYFREEFLPRDFNDKVWEQIKSRTQGDKESIAIYVAYMNNLFSRLTVPVEDLIKLKIIRKNILPFYQSQLLLVDVNSVDQLVKLCRKIEDNRRDILNFVPPSSSKSIVETDLSYREEKSSKKKIDNIELKKVSFLENYDSYSNELLSDTENDSAKGETKSQKKKSHSGSRMEVAGRIRGRSRDSSVDSRESSLDRKRAGHRSRRDFVNKVKSRNRVNSVESNQGDRNNRDFSKDKRDLSRDNSLTQSRDRYENRDYSSEYSRNREYSRDRNRDYSRDRNRDYSRDRNRDYSRDRNRDYSRDRNRDYSRDGNRNYYRDSLNRDFSRDRMGRKEYSKDRFNRDISRDRNNYSRDNNYPRDRANVNRNYRDSFSGGNSDRNQNIVCYKCQGLNHIARFCTKKSENPNGNRF